MRAVLVLAFVARTASAETTTSAASPTTSPTTTTTPTPSITTTATEVEPDPPSLQIEGTFVFGSTALSQFGTLELYTGITTRFPLLDLGPTRGFLAIGARGGWGNITPSEMMPSALEKQFAQLLVLGAEVRAGTYWHYSESVDAYGYLALAAVHTTIDGPAEAWLPERGRHNGTRVSLGLAVNPGLPFSLTAGVSWMHLAGTDRLVFSVGAAR